MRNALLLTSFALALVLAGCGGAPSGGDTDTTASAPAEDDATIVVGMSQCNRGEPWRVQMDADVEAAAAEHPEIKLIMRDAQNDTLKQRSQIEEFIAQGVDVLIVSPKEAAPLTGPIAEAYKKGIHVIVLDRAVLGDDYTVFIGGDNKVIGEAAGRWLAKKLGGKGKVVELKGLMTSVPGHDRSDSFHKGIEGTDIEIIFDADMQWLEDKARKEMESALARFDEIDAVYGHNDPAAHGAYLAAKAEGREKDMIFVGIDALPHEGQAYVKQGILAATFEYPTGGKEAIETALKLVKGEQAPKKIALPTRVYTPENVASGGEAI